jgi:hypothetical protein
MDHRRLGPYHTQDTHVADLNGIDDAEISIISPKATVGTIVMKN